MISMKEEDGFSTASASSLLNLLRDGCNGILNPLTVSPLSLAILYSTTIDADTNGRVFLSGHIQRQQGRKTISQPLYNDNGNRNIMDRNNRNIISTKRRIRLNQNYFSISIFLFLLACFMPSTSALVYHSTANVVARHMLNASIRSTTTHSSSLFYKRHDSNDSYNDPTSDCSASANTSNANVISTEEEGNCSSIGNSSSSNGINAKNNPMQFARAKRARKLHRHPSKKAKKKSGKDLNDDVIVELLPSLSLSDDFYLDDDDHTSFILSEPGEGETWLPPFPTSSSSTTTFASSVTSSSTASATTTSESCNRLDRHPALVLNADYQPLRMLPLSIWSWQDTIKAVLSGKAVVVDIHPNIYVRAVSLDMPVPSVIALREYAPTGKARPAFTRRNVFLRDGYRCQYCSNLFRMSELSLDHVEPRCMGGKLTWENTVTCCMKCNGRKGCLRPSELHRVGMELKCRPKCPTLYELAASASNFVPRRVHPTWAPFLGMSSFGGVSGGSGTSSSSSMKTSSSKD